MFSEFFSSFLSFSISSSQRYCRVPDNEPTNLYQGQRQVGLGWMICRPSIVGHSALVLLVHLNKIMLKIEILKQRCPTVLHATWIWSGYRLDLQASWLWILFGWDFIKIISPSQCQDANTNIILQVQSQTEDIGWAATQIPQLGGDTKIATVSGDISPVIPGSDNITHQLAPLWEIVIFPYICL